MDSKPAPALATYTENLIDALVELDIEVYVVRMSRFGQKSPELMRNVVESIPLDKVALIHVQHEYGIWQGLEGGFYGELARTGKPVVTTMHATGINMSIDKTIASASSRVIVHNQFCAKLFRNPCVIIPHGAKPGTTVPPEEAKKSLGIPPRSKVVGYCGFLGQYKGLETLIEAVEKLPDVALLIAGGWHAGPDTEYIAGLKQASLARLPGRCQWLGWVEDERLPTAYGAMNLVVYPSTFASESGALIMALSHGRAVISSSIRPFKEKEKQGTLMTFRSVSDLRRKIRLLFSDGDLRARLEEGARRWTAENSWANAAARHLNLYKEVLEAKK